MLSHQGSPYCSISVLKITRVSVDFGSGINFFQYIISHHIRMTLRSILLVFEGRETKRDGSIWPQRQNGARK